MSDVPSQPDRDTAKPIPPQPPMTDEMAGRYLAWARVMSSSPGRDETLHAGRLHQCDCPDVPGVQPDRDTAFTAWFDEHPSGPWPGTHRGLAETFAAGWDAATRAEQQRWLSAIQQLHSGTGENGTEFCDHDGFVWPCRTTRIVADLLGGDHD